MFAPIRRCIDTGGRQGPLNAPIARRHQRRIALILRLVPICKEPVLSPTPRDLSTHARRDRIAGVIYEAPLAARFGVAAGGATVR